MNDISRIKYKGRAYEFEELHDILNKAICFDVEISSGGKSDSVAVISSDPRKLKTLLDSAACDGLTIEQINPCLFVEKFDVFTESLWTSVFAFLDDCGDMGSVFDALRRFRDAFPETLVILISADFSTDDLSCERLPLADVSLKSPLSARRVDEAMNVAFLNNVLWQARVQELVGSNDDEDTLVQEDAEAIASVICPQH